MTMTPKERKRLEDEAYRKLLAGLKKDLKKEEGK